MFKRVLHRIVHVLHLLTYSWRALGPRVIARNLLALGADREARSATCGFDATWGTDTDADVTPREAAIPVTRRANATMYVASLDRDLDALLAALPWPESLRRAATFVDVGSGKGRVVLMAAMRRFREVIGVELSPVLHAIAERNLATVRSAGALISPVRVELRDASELEVPRGPFVLYLYHPFRDEIAAAMLARVIASLEASPRPAAILYCHPTLQPSIDRSVLGAHGVFDPVAEGARRTRYFHVGWTVWTNASWLDACELGIAS